MKHLTKHRLFPLVLLAAGMGLFLRIWLINQPAGALDSDEAIPGLMALHLLRGEFSPFYWAQAYGGTAEIAVVAAAFKIFGPSVAALKLVPAFLHAISALLVWRIGARAVDETTGGVAGALFWIFPAGFVWMSIKERGFYGISLALALGAVLLCMRLEERGSWGDFTLLGLCAGLAWWGTPQSALLVVPALAWLLLRSSWFRWRVPALSVGIAIGALPYLVHNMRYGWPSLDATRPLLEAGPYRAHLQGFIERALPMVLGFRVPWSGEWLIPDPVGAVSTGAFLGGVLISIVEGAWRRRWPLVLLGAVVILYPFLFSFSSYAWFVDEPRYLVMLSPALAIFLAYFAARWRLEAVVLVVALLLTALGLARLNQFEGRPYQVGEIRVPPDLGPLIQALEERDVGHAFADYWIAHRISFETTETIVGAPMTGFDRYPPHSQEVRAGPNPAYIFYAGTAEDGGFPLKLALLGVDAERVQIEWLAIYFPSQKVLPEQVL